MNWEITPFVGIGPVKLGMSIEEVSALLGPAEDTDGDKGDLTEYRSLDMPTIFYRNGLVSEVEVFYDTKNVSLRGLNIFGKDGRKVMRELEEMNGGAGTHVGTVLFNELGITTGRLDERARGDHSLTIFRKGTWDHKLDKFTPITFG